jgi:uncharacterized membrane protein
MENNFWLAIWEYHSGKIVGTLGGLFLGILVITLGFFKALFVLMCMTLGFLIGKRIDQKEDIMEILDRILPPGHR